MQDLSLRDLQALVAYMALSCREKPLGKKATQKLVYLFQNLCAVKSGYRFDFYTYGVYSRELAGDLDILRSMNVINISYVKENKSYEIRDADFSDRFIENSCLSVESCKQKVDRFLQNFGGLEPWELEIISTAVFIKTNEKIELSDIAARVFELKPKFPLDEIKNTLTHSGIAQYIH